MNENKWSPCYGMHCLILLNTRNIGVLRRWRGNPGLRWLESYISVDRDWSIGKTQRDSGNNLMPFPGRLIGAAGWPNGHIGNWIAFERTHSTVLSPSKLRPATRSTQSYITLSDRIHLPPIQVWACAGPAVSL